MESNLLKINYELKQENIKLKKENIELRKENAKLKSELKRVNGLLSNANHRINVLEKQIEDMRNREQSLVEEVVTKAVAQVTEKLNQEHKKEVDALNAKILRLEQKLNIDSTTSNTPTSKNKIGKHVIQNNREKTDKKIGGQENHTIHKLERFQEEEITDRVEYTLDKCPSCGGKLLEKNTVTSDILDIKVTIIKTRNSIHNYYCNHCHKNVSANNKLPRGVSYGDNINSIALSLMNEANTPLNKISSFFNGISNGEISLSEGYLCKLQKKTAQKLKQFENDLSKHILTLPVVHWDDTVCVFGMSEPAEGYDEKDKKYMEEKDDNDKKGYRQGVIRFYGDDHFALLIGHRHKDFESIINDNILPLLPATCIVSHDHVLLNYNPEFKYKNSECNIHVCRALKKVSETFPNHTWALKMRDLLLSLNEDKKKAVLEEKTNFLEDYLKAKSHEYDQIIKLAYEENDKVDIVRCLDKGDELNLIERLEKFKENHLLFIYDFSAEFTNNTAERGLRQVKRKLAVSFMFSNANRLKDYAVIISYLETCYRNGISRYDAAKRLVSGNPYSVDEIIAINEKSE